MQIGERADLFIQSKYGYGDAGSPPKIPGGATLIFTVELVSIDGKKVVRPHKDVMADALKAKEEGNAMFKAKNFKEAVTNYR